MLDGLRLVAALMVMSFHYVSGAAGYWGVKLGEPVFPGAHLVTAYGWMGVNLFFVISGFVICMSCWGRGVSEFFVSRVTRLYPAFWVAVIFTSVVVTIIPADHPRLSPRHLLANLTMFPVALGVPSVDGVYWTLWNESLFYLLFAVVVWRGLTYRSAVWFCALWTTASLLAPMFKVPALSTIVDHEYSMYFIGGIVLYLMRRFRPNPLLWAILGFSVLLALNDFGTRLTAINAMTGERQNWWVGAGVVVACFGAVLVIALGWVDRISWRWLTPAGALTYPLYLIHAVAGCALINYLSPKASKYVVLAGVITGMLILAWLCHRLVERPLSRAMRRWLNAGIRAVREEDAPTPPARPAGSNAPDRGAAVAREEELATIAPATAGPMDPRHPVAEAPSGAMGVAP